MSGFKLELHDATRSEHFENVSSFVGEDPTGSFGILAHHQRSITVLDFGLAKFRIGDQAWQYLALPGAVLYFHDNVLTLSTRRYLLSDDFTRISDALTHELETEELDLLDMKLRLRKMEEAVLRRLWQIGRSGIAE